MADTKKKVEVRKMADTKKKDSSNCIYADTKYFPNGCQALSAKHCETGYKCKFHKSKDEYELVDHPSFDFGVTKKK